MRRFVRRICTAPPTSMSASPATITSVPTMRANGANRPSDRARALGFGQVVIIDED